MGQDVNLDITRAQIIIPPTGSPPQVCTTDGSPLQFRIDNSGTASYTVTGAQSIIVTLTLSGGNTFSPSGLTTKVHTYTSAPVVKAGSPASTLDATGGFAVFDWPAAKQIVFTNTIQASINIEIATGVASDTTPANNTADYVIDIITDPVTPVVSAGSYGDGTINLCQGANVIFTVLPTNAGLRHEFDIDGTVVQNLVNVNTYATTGLVTNQLINVTSYNTSNCGVTGNPIRALVHPVPVGNMFNDKNNIVCPGEDVLFTAQASGAAAVSPRFEFFFDSVSVGASSTTTTFSLGTASITLDGHTVRVRTWNNTGASGLCYDEDTITLRLNTFSGSNIVTTTTVSVCTGVDPAPITSISNFSSDIGGDIVHVWQEDIIGDGSFNNISPAATSDSYDPPILTRTTAYRRLSYPRFSGIECISSVASATSNIVTITFNPAVVPVLLSNTTSNTLCKGDNLVLDASNSSNALSFAFYRNSIWISSSTLSNYTFPQAVLSDTDTITLRAYDNTAQNGCFADSSFVLRINSLTGANTISNSTNACFGEVPTPFTSVSTPSVDRLVDGATFAYQWQSRKGTDPFVNILGPLGKQETLSPSAIISSTTDFQRIITSTFNTLKCSSVSNPITISVIPIPTGTIVGNDTACLGEDVIFTASGGDVYEFFENSISLGASSTVNTMSISGLAHLDLIKVEVTDTSSCTAFSNTITMTILAVPNAAISSGLSLDIVCSGEYPTFTAGPVVAGLTYQFFVNSSPQITGVTGNTFDSNAVSTTLVLSATNVISVNVSNGACTDTDSLTLIVNSTTNANSISATQTICSGGTPQTLSDISAPIPVSGVATIGYQWQERTAGSTFTNIALATSANYSPSAISTTTFYRRLAFTHLNTLVCPATGVASASNVVTVTVDTNAVPVISFNSGLPSNVMCSGDSVTFDASGTTGVGTTYQYFIDDIPVHGPTTASTYTPNAGTLGTINDFSVVKVRAISASSSLCFAEQSITMRLNEQSVANTISASQTICEGNTPALLTGSTVTGTPTITYQWQAKSGTNTFTNISSANNITYQPSALATTTVFRRNVISTLGTVSCTVNSDSVTITVITGTLPVARITSNVPGSHVACAGESFTFDASNSTGGLSFQFFVDGAPLGVASTTSTTIILLSTVTSTVRVDVYPQLNGVGCPSSASLIATVNSITGSNRIGGTTTVCAGGDPDLLTSLATPTSATGSITYQWQSRAVGGVFSDISPLDRGLTYDPPIPTSTTGYMRLAQSTINGVTCSIPSNVVTITLDATPLLTGTLTSTLSSQSETICFGSQDNITFGVGVAGTPTIVFYVNDSAVQTGTSKTYTVSQSIFTNGNVVKSRVINAGGCFTEDTLNISVNQMTAGSILGSQAVCAGDAPLMLTSSVSGTIFGVTIVSPGTGSYQWEDSVDNINWLPILLATSDTFTPPVAPPAGRYYRRLTVNTLNGFECSQPTNSILVSVDPLPIPLFQANAGAITAPATMTSCVSSTINFTGSGGIQYEFFVNDISIQARGGATTFSTASLVDSDEVHLRVYKTATASSCFDDSSDIKVTIGAIPAIAISTTSITSNTFCTGAPIAMQATPIPG
ncbi:MAG: beta strand repeat-containing protein, partial [Flavobacteriales bacterium]